jgi:2-polyprenyl-3-methyl-5-hydroxy-6-metoxy-1,4-benzoquinol methylase
MQVRCHLTPGSLAICRQCGLGMSLEPPALAGCGWDAEEISRRYQADRDPRKAALCWKLLQRHCGGIHCLKSVFDVGCSDGAFLDLARRAGLDTAGIELSPGAAQRAWQKGHRVQCGSATEPTMPASTAFDVVTMWDVLEHMARPRKALEYAAAILRPGGRLLVVTPLMGSPYDRLGFALHRISGGRWQRMLRMCWSGDHLFRFHPKGLCRLLHAMGFEDVRAWPMLLLSLRSGAYAGGVLNESWTASARLDRCLSRAGVATARLLRLHNKVLVQATWPSR